ncbi:acyl-CoA dehydrogenase C-terminal domain-containing protein [Methylocella sp.]|uniref:acyl-CoA dehydrogenase C-terminal domain-containing protein n=1 Tax=Methylocella sp. TaxID=1978226 RepID=UPI0037840E99
MAAYAPPVADMTYLIDEIFAAEAAWAALPAFSGVDAALARQILEEAGKFCAEVARPLNASGDAEGCRLENGAVTTPKGFPEAYAAFVAAGWPGLSASPDHGGQGLPRSLQILVDEMLSAANLSFGLFGGLTRGAAEALERHGSDALKAAYLPKLVEGVWTGAMDLTEAQAGSDLGLLKTRAEPQPDGSYKITGSKIFISSGDHDLAENVVHLVLARAPDAPAGVKGLSLFLAPKFLPKPDGSLGARNAVHVGALERKMGIHAQPTCVMNYDGATGWLVGEPNRGLAAMFTMMNAERLFVGVQGLGLADASYQTASLYARERLQGRGPDGAGPSPIIAHPDVRKMLLEMAAFVEAGRALALWTALEMDRETADPDPAAREAAGELVALMTPVVKAAFTDFGFRATTLGQQVLGGHGYIREWGQEQFVRDARIAQIYEGTNGIQAADLVGRKLPQAGGRPIRRFVALVEASCASAEAQPGAEGFVRDLREALAILAKPTARFSAGASPAETGAAATDYLRLLALVAFGWMWLRMAAHALAQGEAASPHARRKLALARFYFARMLPEALGLGRMIEAGAPSIVALDAEAF